MNPLTPSPLRIAYLLKKFPRLSETFVLNEILAQEALGTQIEVLARRPHDPEPLHPQFARLQASIREIDSARSLEPWVQLFEPENAKLLERFGQCVRELKRFEHPRIAGLLAEALEVRSRALAAGIRHIHAHFATDSAVVAMLVRELGGPPYSITAHAKDIYRSTVNPELLSRMFERSAFTVTVCDANVRHLEGMLTPAALGRVRRLYNGIDLDMFRSDGTTRDAEHVLCVGRLVEKKGYRVLIDALALLRDEGRRFQATFIGEGEERTAIEARIAETRLQQHITLAGGLDQTAVRACMARATLMCMPCIVGDDGNRDALPTTLIEAGAMELPSISTPVTGIPEILGHGSAGVLVPENDVPATARAIASLLDDPARARALGRAARTRCEELFDGRKSAATLREWFAESMQRG